MQNMFAQFLSRYNAKHAENKWERERVCVKVTICSLHNQTLQAARSTICFDEYNDPVLNMFLRIWIWSANIKTFRIRPSRQIQHNILLAVKGLQSSIASVHVIYALLWKI
jgi:hypothetical protein